MLTLELILVALSSASRPEGFTLGPLSADPSCETGVIDRSTCCERQCGTCDGPGCGSRPGGAAGCCGSKIASAGEHCDEYNPPCILSPSPVPPGPPPASTATLELNTAAGIGRVDRKYVSFTFDSSAWREYNLSGTGLVGGTLDVLVQGLLPAHLRVGGTQGDYDIYTGVAPKFPVGTGCAGIKPPMTQYRCKEVTTSAYSSLLAFTARNNLTLVYGLNDMYGRPTKTKPEKQLCDTDCPARDQSNIKALLTWLAGTKPRGWDSIFAFELGNELNSALNGDVGAKTQAADFVALRALVDAVWPSPEDRAAASNATNNANVAPRLVGPDTHSAAEFSSEGLGWFKTFHETAGAAVDFHTFHMYSLGNGPKLDPQKLDASYLSPQSLDRCGEGASALRHAAPGLAQGSLWAGETAAANEGGQTGITDTFIDGFWYLDQLGQLATLNVTVFLRQQLLSTGGYPLVETFESYGGAPPKAPRPLPDYYVAVLHKRLMGQRVLGVTSSEPDIRVYAHCAAGSAGDGGGVTLAIMNLALNKTVAVTLPAALAAAPTREEFLLTAGTPIDGAVMPLQSRSTLLNGQELMLVPGAGAGALPALPPMAGRVLAQSPTMQVPASSYGFVRFAGADVAVCKSGNRAFET